uniref:Uncharacterized protein n=1 Tax=Trypanosoma congolense (strain IL3000) TaxID=1068625 RepID=G0V2S5_TRYCI|nr:hypothetical protein, unlikely [Trypanosoma congolense IL3000]
MPLRVAESGNVGETVGCPGDGKMCDGRRLNDDVTFGEWCGQYECLIGNNFPFSQGSEWVIMGFQSQNVEFIFIVPFVTVSTTVGRARLLLVGAAARFERNAAKQWWSRRLRLTDRLVWLLLCSSGGIER